LPTDQDPIQNAEVLEGVASLVDKSLVRQAAEPAGEPRLGMLETIREFGAAAWAEGRTMPLDAAIESALDEPGADPAPE
jgi:hypothetical protein